MKKDLTDKEKEERMNYLTIHKCKNEDERKELKNYVIGILRILLH